jgi:hypothetical protein
MVAGFLFFWALAPGNGKLKLTADEMGECAQPL